MAKKDKQDIPTAAAIEEADAKFAEADEALQAIERDLYEKNDRIHEAFQLAGAELDFSRPKVLALTDASDHEAATKKVQGWNREVELVGMKRDAAIVRRQSAKAALDALVGEQQQKADKRPVNQLPFPSDGPRSKGLGELIVDSAAFQDFRTSGKPSKAIVPDYGLRELKAVFSTTAGWPPESTRIPGLVIPEAVRPIQVLDIIPPGTTGQAAIVYMEETTATFAAAERAEAAAYAEATFVLTEQTSTVRSIGASIPVTDEQLEDVAGVQSYLEQRLGFGVRQRLDSQILVGDGIAPNLLGINNVAGIQTQAKAADSVPDAVYKALDLIRVTGRAIPSAVVFHPNDWQDVRLLKTADGIYIWGSPSEAGPQRIWGVSAVLSDAQTENTALAGDYLNFSQLFERRGLEVAVGFVNDDFLDGRRTIRAGLRAAFVVYRPAAFATITGI